MRLQLTPGRLTRCLSCCARRLASTQRTVRVAAASAEPQRPRDVNSKPRAPAPTPSSGDSKDTAESEKPQSNRAAFRAVPLDSKVMARIQELKLCMDTSAAGRLSTRKSKQGDQRQLTRRYPLYGEVPPSLVRVAGGDQHPRAKFVAAAGTVASLPTPGVPEVAFAGRSNVGKSSLINALTLAPVARQSDKPGKTQSLNFFSVGDSLSFVDLPGYGFAFAQPGRLVNWNSLIDEYLGGRGAVLKRVIVVLDARHGIKVNDREMLRFLADAHVKFQVVLNKTDEVVPNDLCRRWSLVMEELGKLRGAHPIVHMVSTATGAGIAPLAAELCQLAKAAPAKPQAADAAGGAAKPALSLAMRPHSGDASLGKLPRKAALSNLGEDLPRRASRDRLEAALRELQEKGKDDDV